jgi:hypothetical protein
VIFKDRKCKPREKSQEFVAIARPNRDTHKSKVCDDLCPSFLMKPEKAE